MKKAFNKLFHGNTDPVRKKARAIRYTYSSVPNRRAGRNKRAGGKILKDQNRRAEGKFSGKSINVQGGNFLENQ